MKPLFLLISVLYFSSSTFAQSNPDDIIKKFFNSYSNNSTKALDELYATNPWTERIKDAIENLKKEVSGYTVDYMGKYYGYEIIIKKQFSESFILYSYMVKYDRQPMRFTFELYKPNDNWRLFSFKIDSDMDDEIEEAAKLYHLKLDK